MDILDPSPTPTSMIGNSDLSGTAPEDWEKLGRTANIRVLDFNKDFGIQKQQTYTLWHANWEVYVGPFVSASQDGIFLYDRSVGEGRLMSFNNEMLVTNYKEMHNLDGNWVVYTGDFTDSGRAQMLLYDPSSGDAQVLTFAHDLTLASQKTYSDWGTNMVLYVGHFGMPALSIMLYDPQAGKSTFLAFDQSLEVTHQYTVTSWDQNWQILIGAFIDRSQCAKSGNCSNGDDILVLNRQTGQVVQYAFSFGRTFKVFDNRAQAFIRDGLDAGSYLNSVDTTSFSMLNTVDTEISNEELY